MSGDYKLEDSVYILFTTRAFATGVPGVLSAATVAVYEDVTSTPIETSIAVTETLNSINGLNAVTIAAQAANGYNAGGHYHVVIEAGTVDSVSVVGEVVGNFSIAATAAAQDLANGTDGLSALKTLVDAIQTDLDNGTDGLGALLAACATVTGHATEAKQDIIDTNIDQIEAAVITNAAGVDIAADIIAMKAETALIIADTADIQPNYATEAKQDTAQTDLDTITGTSGVLIGTDAANVTEISDAVWDESTSAHAIAGSFGKSAADVLVDTADVQPRVAAIEIDTNELQSDWTNTGRLDTIIDSILADTGELQADDVPGLIATLDTVVDTVKAETVLILADTADIQPNYATSAALTTAQSDLDTISNGIITGTAATGTLAVGSCTSSLTGYTDDQLIGRIITFLAGPADGESSDITDYANTNGLITFTALTLAPEDGNAFKIT